MTGKPASSAPNPATALAASSIQARRRNSRHSNAPMRRKPRAIRRSRNTAAHAARAKSIATRRARRHAARTPDFILGAGLGGFARSGLAVAVSDAIQGFDLSEIGVHRLEFLPQALDVAIDGAVVDIDVLAIGAVHQLVAALDVAGPGRERFQDQEFGHGQIDALAFPAALVAARIERQLAALDHRLGRGLAAAA